MKINIKNYLNTNQFIYLQEKVNTNDNLICYDCFDNKLYNDLFDTDLSNKCYKCGNSGELLFLPLKDLHKKYKDLNITYWFSNLPRVRENILSQLY
jgi:hypothetical protein